MKNILLITIATMLILGACKRDNSISNLPDVYHYLTLSQIQKTPYFINPDFDTLTFVSNKNDTLIFARIKTDTSYYKTYERWCFDCRTQTNYHQTLRNTYQTLKGNGKFEVKHSLIPNHIVYAINNTSFTAHEVNVGYNNTTTFKDSITFNNITYLRAIRLSNNQNYGFVNIEQGLFYVFDSLTNDYLQLINN